MNICAMAQVWVDHVLVCGWTTEYTALQFTMRDSLCAIATNHWRVLGIYDVSSSGGVSVYGVDMRRLASVSALK
jgi:hypothetical protein